MPAGNLVPTRREFIVRSLQTAALVGAAPLLASAAVPAEADRAPSADTAHKVGEEFVSERREITDAKTGRKLIQLTSGDCFDMPMYYFIPTFAADNKTIVFQRYDHHSGEIQLYKVHSETGATMRLTDAKTQNSLWRPYLQQPGFGVRDLQSCVNAATNEAIYFDTNEIRAVNLVTLKERVIGHVPEGRVPSGLTGVSPNGKWFCYPHFDRKWWEKQLSPSGNAPAHSAVKDSKLVVIDLESGAAKDVLTVDFWITHTNFYDNDRILFCHDASGYAVMLADVRRPGLYEYVRKRSAEGFPNHYAATSKGVMYEVLGEKKDDPMLGGIFNPDTQERKEFKLALSHGRLHIGRDPDARLWFFENAAKGGVTIVYFPRLSLAGINRGVPLMSGDYSTFANNQRSHYHSSVTPDRKSILFTGGDNRNKTNHLFLLDISDLKDTELVS